MNLVVNDSNKTNYQFLDKYNWLTSPFILSISYFILFFLIRWYSDELFDLISILIFPLFIFLIVFHNYCLYWIIKSIFKDYKIIINYFSLLILISGTIVGILVPSRQAKIMLELNLYENKRINVIRKIKKGELKPYYLNNVRLPLFDKMISSTGEVYVYKNDNDVQIIGFWVLRGIASSGSISLIYSSTDENSIKKNVDYIRKIKKLKDNWYYVETDY